ncbi:PucR family transcriptional regulator [Dethiobacter alkaliphilus]|uniref:PucR family transcriptional regulator n=1 Tax=Dethiobacter alkaliphilus TaxID=427926 RepID=UPI0022272D64|nr:PucR family transcriptional regulator [Dethiobacter alkaliphilus]MCW3490323.1 PucR family transcriptional regulator ligand-binding domain-containing protein [Dethiobacter alkaliphilus]
MTLTVHEALHLDVLRDAKVRAGWGGLERKIKWVNILEILEELNVSRDGELLITTAFGLKDNPGLQQQLIPHLVEKGLACLAIQTGYYLQEIPSVILRQADLHNLPVVELPRDTMFANLSKAILTRLINHQFQVLSDSQELQHRLTQLVLKNKGLSEILSVLAELLDRKVRLVDNNYRLLADGVPPDGGEADTTGAIEEEFQWLRKYGILDTLEKDKKAAEVQESKHVSAQVIAPVMSGDTVTAYLSAVGDSHTFSELDLAALYQAATLCSLVLLKEAAVRDTEDRLKGDFLDDLLSGNYPSEEIVLRRARFLGYESIHRGVFMLFKANEFETLEKLSEPEIIQIKTDLISLIQEALAQKNIHSICRLQSATVIVLILEEGFLSGDADVGLATELKEEIEQKMKRVTVSAGLGRPYRELGKLAKSFAEGEKALRIAQKIGDDGGVFRFSDLGAFRLLLSENEAELNAFYRDTVEKIVEDDRKNNGELLKSLKVYLDENRNIKEAASKLFIHRHTLKYRLNKIAGLTGRDLDNSEDLLNLHLGILISYILGE